MQEPYGEGVVTHTAPESCGYIGNDVVEALTGVQAGRVLSRVSSYVTVRSADAVENDGRQNCVSHYHEMPADSARSKTPHTFGNFLRRNWDVPSSTLQDGSEVRTVNPNGAIQ